MLTLIVILAIVLALPAALRVLITFLDPDPHDHNPYRYGCRRHHTILGTILPVIALVTLDRLFDLRR